MWIWVAAGLGLIPLAIMAVAAHVGWKVSHPRRKPLERFPEDEGLVGEKVEFVSRQGQVTLRGWFIPAENDRKIVIFAHGYGENPFP